jgi:hypothetical protein
MDLYSFLGLHFKHELKIVNLVSISTNLAYFDFLFKNYLDTVIILGMCLCRSNDVAMASLCSRLQY